jgi:hypothetical protein
MLSHQILYSVEDVEKIAAQAYRSGITAGFTLAIKEEVLELQAKKQEEERQKIINWQGLCESGQGGESWD